MLTEAVRVVADWLANPVWGVNATLAATPREADVPAVPPVAVYDESRDGEVTRGQIPDDLPALLVQTTATPLSTVATASRPFPADYSVELGIRYGTATVDTAAGFNEAALVMRAVHRCLGQLWVTSAGEAARVRGQMQLVELRDTRIEQYQANDDSRIAAACILTVRMRDLHTNA